MRTAATAFRFQLSLLRRDIHQLHALATTPLLTLVFLAIAGAAGRRDLTASCVLAPTLIALWTSSLALAGELIGDDRANGRLEALLATPVRLSTVVTGRLAAAAVVGLVCFLEAYAVAGLVFGQWLTVRHPVLLTAATVVTALAMAGTATSLSALFVRIPSARTVQNTLTYPVYLLGGVLLPVALLPGWAQPASRLIFLSWSADLIRDSIAAAHVPGFALRLGIIAILGLAGYALGVFLIGRSVRRVRHLGTLTHT